MAYGSGFCGQGATQTVQGAPPNFVPLLFFAGQFEFHRENAGTLGWCLSPPKEPFKRGYGPQ